MTQITKLPNGLQQFWNNSGAPLAAGTVTFYYPNTTTPKNTWQNNAQSILNTNPVLLDANGRASIYGYGSYRQIVKDSLGNLIWDTTTEDVSELVQDGSLRYGGTSTGGAGVFNVTMGPPLVAYQAGQNLLFKVHQASQGGDVININGLGNLALTMDGATPIGASNIASGMIVEICLDGTNAQLLNPIPPAPAGFPAGVVVPFAGATVPVGWVLCAGQAIGRVANPNLFTAIGTTYGAGDGSTTFNVPDLRGRAVFGQDNMGGTAANRLTNAGSGTPGTTLGGSGGNELLQTHNHAISVTDPTHTHANTLSETQGTGGAANDFPAYGTAASLGKNTPAPIASTDSIVISAASTGISATAGNTGSGSSQNVPPAMIMNYIIKAG